MPARRRLHTMGVAGNIGNPPNHTFPVTSGDLSRRELVLMKSDVSADAAGQGTRAALVPVMAALAIGLTGCTAPGPLSHEESVTRSLRYLDAMQGTASGTVQYSLEDAVTRALRYNAEYRARTLSAAIATGNRKLAAIEMLPDLTADAGYRRRSNALASSSKSINTGLQTLEPSTSSDPESHVESLELAWNVLDFGLSYYQARELGEQELIAREERRKAMNEITRDVVYSWTLSSELEYLQPEIEAARSDLQAALSQSDALIKLRLREPVEVLEYQRTLLLVLKRLDRLVLDMRDARNDLARLLYLPAGKPFSTSSAEMAEIPSLAGLPLDTLQQAALASRPEIRAAQYESRIAGIRAKKAWLEFLPSLSIGVGANRDSNSYLMNNDWNDTSAQVSWNLMRLAALPAARKLGKMGIELASIKEQLQVAAVMSQVAIASETITHARRAECISDNLVRVDAERVRLLEARQAASNVDELTLIRARVDNLLLRAERAMDHAAARRSQFTMLVSIGMDILPPALGQSAAQQADDVAVAREISAWWREGLPVVVKRDVANVDVSVGDSPDVAPGQEVAGGGILCN